MKLESIRLPLTISALIVHFINFRYLKIESYHVTITYSAFLLQIIAIFISLTSSYQSSKLGFRKESKIWFYSSYWQFLALFGVSIFFAKETILELFFAKNDLAEKALFLMWFFPLIWSGFWAVGIENSIKATGRGKTSDPQFVLQRGKRWLGIGLLFSSLILINYSANRLDKGYDWSYLKTTEPGEATRSLLATVDQEVEVVAFFSRKSEVKPFISEYLQNVSGINSSFKVRFEDKDFSPQLAEQFRASANGQIIMLLDGKRQRISIGDNLEQARKNLRKLDELFLKDLFSLLQEKKFAYFVQGHGEMKWLGSKENPARSITLLEKMFRLLNFRIKTLPLTTGRFSQVPNDADLLIIAGPTQDFSDNEILILKDYISRGGKLLAYLDIEFSGEAEDSLQTDWRLDKWLAELGVNFKREQLADTKRYLRLNRQISDRAFLATNNFSSHPAVKVLSENERKMGLIVNHAGYFLLSNEASESNGWKASAVIKSYPSSFNDRNANYLKDAGEKSMDFPIAVVLEKEKSRIALFSDASMVSDPLVSNPGNQLAVLTIVKWLTNDESWSGGIDSEEDVKILHSREEDIFMFYGTISMVPLLILFIGFLANFRRKDN